MAQRFGMIRCFADCAFPNSGVQLCSVWRYDIPAWRVMGTTPGRGHLEGSCFDDQARAAHGLKTWSNSMICFFFLSLGVQFLSYGRSPQPKLLPKVGVTWSHFPAHSRTAHSHSRLRTNLSRPDLTPMSRILFVRLKQKGTKRGATSLSLFSHVAKGFSDFSGQSPNSGFEVIQVKGFRQRFPTKGFK